jgi:hypothetical protein
VCVCAREVSREQQALASAACGGERKRERELKCLIFPRCNTHSYLRAVVPNCSLSHNKSYTNPPYSRLYRSNHTNPIVLGDYRLHNARTLSYSSEYLSLAQF